MQSPSWEANWFAASQETPRISRNPKVHYRTHKRPPPVSILGQPNPVHIPTSHLLEIHPNGCLILHLRYQVIITIDTAVLLCWSVGIYFHNILIIKRTLNLSLSVSFSSSRRRIYKTAGTNKQFNYSWLKRDQLDVTCFIISLFNAQHVSDVNPSILRRLRLTCWVISWVTLICKE